MNELLFHPNYLIIAAEGKKVGKTSFICSVIKNISKYEPVTAVKFCPHFHLQDSKEKFIIQTKEFEIIEETDPLKQRDSSLMLAAGATKVYFVQVKDDQLFNAFRYLKDYLPTKTPVIIESGGLRKILIPGLFLHLCHLNRIDTKPMGSFLKPLADKCIVNNGQHFDYDPVKVNFSNGTWSLTEY